MKPELQKIFTKLSDDKIEKTELALIDDVKALADKFESILSEIYKLGEEANQKYEQIQRLAPKATSAFQASSNAEQQLESALKAVGANPSSNRELKRLISLQDDFLRYRKRYSF